MKVQTRAIVVVIHTGGSTQSIVPRASWQTTELKGMIGGGKPSQPLAYSAPSKNSTASSGLDKNLSKEQENKTTLTILPNSPPQTESRATVPSSAPPQTSLPVRRGTAGGQKQRVTRLNGIARPTSP